MNTLNKTLLNKLYFPSKIVESHTVFSSRKYNLTIRVEITNSDIEPYFKVYNSYQRFKATKVASISFYRPEYINSKNKLTENEKKALVECLQNIQYISFWLSIWQRLIIIYNEEKAYVSYDDTINITRENIFLYKQALKYNEYGIEYDELDYLLPFDLPMPNYLLLKE